MNGFTESTKEAYELYAQGKVKEAFSQLGQGSYHYEYLKLIEELKAGKGKVTKIFKKMLKDFANRHPYELSDEVFQTLVDRLIRMGELDLVKKITDDNHGLYFNHEKPYYAQNLTKKREESLGPNKWIQADHFSEEALIENANSNHDNVNSLHKSLWDQVNFAKFSDQDIENLLNSQTSVAFITTDKFMKKVASCISNKFNEKDYGRYYSIPAGYFDKMTLAQMDTLKKMCSKAGKDSNFRGKYFEKTYHDYFQDPEFYQCASLQEKRDLFLRILSEYKQDQCFRTCLIRQILEYGIILDTYDKDLFKEYLAYPISSSYLKEKSYTSQGDPWSHYYNNLKLHKFGEYELYRRILEHYYASGEGWKSFEKFFEKDWIKGYRIELDYLAGVKLSDQDLQYIPHGMNRQTLIDLPDINQDCFKPSETIKLTVDLKNVTSLYVKVFEFNSLNYFKKTKQPFKTDVNLDGLIATKEFNFEFNEGPQKKHREVFEFPHLDDQVGVFIFELIGGGYSSRAVIKKGALSLIHKSSIAGQLAYIIDEEHHICCSEDTGIWYQNQFFKADVENGGRILIPFEKYQSSDQAILVHEGFAHLESFNRLSEDYYFNASFILHPESLVMGNEAALLIRPELTLNKRKCDLRLLETISATLTTMTYVDNIPVTKTFRNLEVNEANEIPIEFQVPPNLQSVHIAFSCEVKNITKGVNEKMHADKRFNIHTNTDNAKYYESFLRRIHDQGSKGKSSSGANHSYFYYAAGKNGEPLKNVNVTFTFYHSIHNSTATSSLYTDSDGKVDLGPLTDIYRVETNFNTAYGSCSRSYSIPYLQEMVDYPSSIEVLEDEPINIPVPSKKLSKSEISLIQYSESGHTISNCHGALSVTLHEGHSFGDLDIVGLKKGSYKLAIRKLNIEISILVHDGVYWEADGFVLKKNSIIEVKSEQNYLRINSVKVTQHEESKGEPSSSTLKFKIRNADENTRAHVFAFTFLPTNLNSAFKQMKDITRTNLDTEVFPFVKWNNAYQSNRKLGDEYRYVFNRKNAKRFIGNTLEKPQLIMKRLKVRDTTFDTEVVKGGGQYGADVTEQKYNISRAKGSAHHDYYYGGHSQHADNIERLCCLQDEIYGYQNFLMNAAHVSYNLSENERGWFECSFDASKYTTVMILSTGQKATTQAIFDLNGADHNVEKRNLSLTEPLDHTKYFNEVRNTDNVHSGATYRIQDITSTEYIFVDCLDKVKKVCDDLCEIKSVTANKDLFFLLDWDALPEHEKHKKYGEFVCHEVNLFLYFKDHRYFVKVVKPFISSKMEKTFIDHWLLGDFDSILHFQEIGHFDKLNTLEQCLLIFSVSTTDPKSAERLAKRVGDGSDAVSKEPAEMRNRLFDTVLNLISSNKNTQKLELLEEIANAQELQRLEKDQLHYLEADKKCYEMEECRMMKDKWDVFQEEDCLMDFCGMENESKDVAHCALDMREESKSTLRSAAPMKRKAKMSKRPPGNMNERGLMQERNKAKTQFQELENASEYCETHYYQNTNQRVPHLVQPNRFWKDFANHIVDTKDTHNFVSPYFIYGCNNTTEIIAMLAIMDLPFNEPRHAINVEGDKGVKVKAASNLVVFKKEIKQAQGEIDTNLLSIHRFYEYNNPNSKKKLKEFLTHQVYTCEVVVTNVSTDHQSFQVLWQIPEGALPLTNTSYQKTEAKELGPYTTLTFKFHFYFPETGQFVGFPTNITMNEKVVATAKTCHFDVVSELTEITFEMFSDYIQSGDIDKICEFLATANLIEAEKGFKFGDILWLLKDKDTFYKIIKILKDRLIYSNDVWSYSMHHGDKELLQEYLQRNRLVLSRYNISFSEDLFHPSAEYIRFRHLDYYPLVNARAHQMADDDSQGILNREFRETYNRFLFKLAEKESLNTEDKLNWAFYYLLQDKTKEAIDMFAQIDGSTLFDNEGMRIQYDYLGAYLDFYNGPESNFKLAREVVTKYADYPVLYWKGLFQEIHEQLQEFDGLLDLGKDIYQADEHKKRVNLKKSKNLAPALEARLDRNEILLDYMNIPKLDIKYYVIDPELMFSKSPFITQNTDEFSYIKPLQVDTYELDPDQNTFRAVIGQEYASKTLIIEVIGGGKQVFLPYFSTELKVIVNENFGELKVTDQQGSPLAKVYVKVYARHHGGDVKFFRDGYTDIRGKIEYSQSSSGKLGQIEKFSIFIMSDELGSLAKECAPPTNVKKHN